MLQQWQLHSDVEFQVIEERSAQHPPVSPQHRSMTQIKCSILHGQRESEESAGQPHEQIGQLQQLLQSMPKIREQFDQCVLQTALAQQAFGQGRQPEIQAPPPGLVGRRGGGKLPERSWADMSEQGQSHGLWLRDQPPMGGQQLASEDGLTSKDPTLLTCPGSVQIRGPGTQAVNNKSGGTFADREQGKDVFFPPKSELNEHGFLPSMKSHLQAIAVEDSPAVFVARRIKKLGFSSPALLRTYFQNYGEVQSVYATPSGVTANWLKQFRSQQRSSGTRTKLRHASLAFVVMASANCTARILADGPEHIINGVPVLTQAFQHRENAQHPEDEVDECHDVLDSGAMEIGAVDYPSWPSTDSETEYDNTQGSLMLLHCPLPQPAEHAAYGQVAQQDLQ